MKIASELDTTNSGNVRLNIVSDTINLIIEYKYENSNEIKKSYLIFNEVNKFSFEKNYSGDLVSSCYDRLCVDEGILKGESEYICYFSEHGLLRVNAKSFYKGADSDVSLESEFEKLIGNDI